MPTATRRSASVVPIRSLLQRRDVARTPFRWTLDPWPAGRLDGWTLHVQEHVLQEPAVQAVWEAWGGVERLRRELAVVGADEPLAIGAAADPYRPDEAEFGRTRRVLEALLALEGLDVTLTTKSTLVTRDLDRLVRLAARHRLRVRVALPTVDRVLARALEPEAPRPDLRIRTISELVAAGMAVGVIVAPVLPGIGDDPGSIDAVVAAAAGAGATELEANALPLLPSLQAALFPRLQVELPDLVDRARRRHERGAVSPEAYRAGIADLISRLGRKHALAGDGPARPGRAAGTGGPQLALF